MLSFIDPNPETYLGPSQISKIVLFAKNSQWLNAAIHFRKTLHLKCRLSDFNKVALHFGMGFLL